MISNELKSWSWCNSKILLIKKLIFIFCSLFSILCFLTSCDTENDCIKKSGAVVKREIQDISAFDKIRIEEGIELILFQSTEQKIEIETGENLINDISVSITDGELIIKNNISCRKNRGKYLQQRKCNPKKNTSNYRGV